MSLHEKLNGGAKFLSYLGRGGLFNVNLEVTKRCNARCDFCCYWKEDAPCELPDYVTVLKRLQPLSVSITGGEPLLRSDLPQIIALLRKNFDFLVIGLITNGSLLSLEKGLQLWQAGLDELSVSLDYLDERHDQERGIHGLFAHIASVAPKLSASGVNLCFNVMIRRGNFRELPNIIRFAHDLGAKVSLSTYNCWRTYNGAHMIDRSEVGALRKVMEEVKGLKKRFGNITSSEYYMERIPVFFAEREIPGCTAGLNWLQVTPDGMIKRCSDHPAACYFTEWHDQFFSETDCGLCWYSCRGAAQEPWTLERFFWEAKQALIG